MELSNTYVEINLDAIRANYRLLQEKAGVPVMGIIKADAYGHGAVPLAKALEKDCSFFGVSSVAEALELRNAGLKQAILILGHSRPEHFETLVRENIRPAIFTWEDALALSQAAGKVGKAAKCHIAVDTGMSRIGLQVTEENADLCKKISQLPGVVLEGIFSHFAKADEKDLSPARAQQELFDRFYGMLERRGMYIPLRHMDNSAGILNFEEHYNMVRGGISLYGLRPSGDVLVEGLQPAMHWYSRVSHVKTVAPGRAISYGGTFVTEKETVVATIPAGYADGYRRSLSNRFYVMIRGQKAPILGRVCMDQMMVDVTAVSGVQVGDKVTLMGDGISAETIAEAAGSFNYEQVCDISRRVERVYIQDGNEVGRTNYLMK